MKKCLSILMIIVFLVVTFGATYFGVGYYKTSKVTLVKKQTLEMREGLLCMTFQTNTQKIKVNIKNDTYDKSFEAKSSSGNYAVYLLDLPSGLSKITVSCGVKVLFSQEIDLVSPLGSPIKDKLITTLEDTRESYKEDDNLVGDATVLLMNFDIGVCQFIFGAKDSVVAICTDPVGTVKNVANSVQTISLLLTPDSLCTESQLSQKRQTVENFFTSVSSAYNIYTGLSYEEKKDFLEQALGQIAAGSALTCLTAKGAQIMLDELTTTLTSVKTVKAVGKLGKLAYKDGKWTSTAGLIYGKGGKEGNRILHVLEHTVAKPGKEAHNIFSIPKDEILPLIDEAWLKKGAPLTERGGAFEVPVGRVIGTEGETTIRIVVIPGTKEILTAFPVK